MGTYRNIGYKLGSWHDVGWWQLALGEYTTPPVEPTPMAAFAQLPERLQQIFGQPS